MAQKKQKAGSPLSKKDLLRLEKALLEEKQRVLRQSSFTQQVMDTPAAAGDLSSHRTHVADQGRKTTSGNWHPSLSQLSPMPCGRLTPP